MSITSKVEQLLNEHADAIRTHARRTVHDIIEIGRHLAEAKKMAGHGNFLSWIEREFARSEDTAERFIAVHALQRQIPHVAELSLPFSGLYLLAAPSTPRQAVEEVVAKAEAGERMSVVEIKSTIAQARPAKKAKAVKKAPKAVSAKDIAQGEFDAHVLRLVQMTSGARAERFARTAVPVRCIVQLAAFLDGVWREAQKAEKNAVLDVEAAP